MISLIDKVSFLIEDMIEEYQEISGTTTDDNLKRKYEDYVNVLDRLNNRLVGDWAFNNENILEDILRRNFGEYDTLLLDYNNEVIITIPKNQVCMIKDSFICLLGTQEEFEEFKDNDGFPVIFEAIDIDNISSFKTLKE